MAKKVLVVDDEKLIVKGIRFSLEQDEMKVDCAYDGQEALDKAREGDYDLILLDVMLPRMDGFEVCRAVREFSNVPIVMLTAKGDDMDKIMGLEYGADDYITKPFNILEVKSQEAEEDSGNVVKSGDVSMDTDRRSLRIAGEDINLTSKEFDMLLLLVNHPGKVYSRDSLLHTIWGSDYPGDARTVDVHIRRLREKIEPSPSEPRYVHTKWGVGYYFQA